MALPYFLIMKNRIPESESGKLERAYWGRFVRKTYGISPNSFLKIDTYHQFGAVSQVPVSGTRERQPNPVDSSCRNVSTSHSKQNFDV